MNMTHPVDSLLLNRYLEHRCTPAEVAQVEAFLRLPEGRDMLDALLAERLPADMADSAHFGATVEMQAHWQQRMRERMGATAVVRPIRKWWKAAVAAAVIGGAGWFASQLVRNAYRAPAPVMAFKQTSEGRRAVIRLTDGSVIYLGAGSQVRYPEKFDTETRDVYLEGEAFFEIARRPGQPFMVHTGAVRTTVLGTSFRVSAFDGSRTLVAVATGKVRVDHVIDGKPQELAVLTPGKELSWERKEGAYQVAQVKAEDVEAWKGGRLVFQNQPVSEIARELERWYGIDITCNKAGIARQKLTVTLSGAAPLEQTMELLAAGGGFSYILQPGKVIIH